MIHKLRVSVLLAWLLCCGSVQAGQVAWQAAFDVIYQAQWAETGELQSVVRWPGAVGSTLSFSINAAASADSSARARRSLHTVAGLAGFRTQELASGAPAQIRFEISHYSDSELARSRCSTRSTSSNGMYLSAVVSLSEQVAYRCVLHELLHAFGLPGHPAGDSVLSYFGGNPLALSALDEFMLRSLYSDRVTPEMPALALVRELTAQWMARHVSTFELAQAQAVEQRWFDQQLLALRTFACQQGPPPAVLARSGRLTEAGLAAGRQQARAALMADC